MDIVNKTIRYNELLSVYQNLLSKTQKEILIDYFNYDLSLSEIAESRGVSRAAIEDAISKGIKKMEAFEAELRIVEKKQELLKNTAKIKEITNNKEILDILKKIEG